VIAYRGFSKSFGTQPAVVDLTLDVAAGEVVALLGPNGSGKTTALKAAAGLVQPSAGQVLLGAPPRPASEPVARRVLSYLPQRVAFPETLSGREVLEFYRALRGSAAARTDELLRLAALNGAAARATGTYSGGMLQRLGLAVALLPEAPLLLLDEPTAALDPQGLDAFHGLLESARQQGRGVLFSSHQLGDLERRADRFAVLVKGRLVALMGARELKDRLAARGVMRLRAARPVPALIEALHALAPQAAWVGDELVVPGPAALRPSVLDVARAAGVDVLGLTAEEGRLDAFYRELVGEHS
jgi:Cu-processing system ATP-binding protein